jgi:ubiquinol-cytochrome c reductase cytochrome c1 subunit
MMSSMKKLFAILVFSTLSLGVLAESGVDLASADRDAFDQLSVIRGAEYFGQYCLGCHSLKQIRYSRLSKDLRLNESRLREVILFGENKIHDSIHTAFDATAATEIFGAAPPDLSLVVRSRGADWVYTYLKSFYEDSKRPFGVNNALLPNAAMPNVLWDLQGSQQAVVEEHGGKSTIVGVKSLHSGSLTPRQFDAVANDIVNFLAYVSEPSLLQRIPLGKYVIAFLLFLTWIFYQLKKEYWKDID